jgi:hypothetical protein
LPTEKPRTRGGIGAALEEACTSVALSDPLWTSAAALSMRWYSHAFQKDKRRRMIFGVHAGLVAKYGFRTKLNYVRKSICNL